MIDKKRYYRNLKNYLLEYISIKDIYKKYSESFALLELSKVTEDKIILAVSFFCLLGIIKELYDVVPKFQIFKENMATIYNKDDQEYLEVKKKYDKYVKEIASEIKKQGLQDPLEIGIYFTIKLHKGSYSKENKFNYKKVKRDNDIYYNGTLGARIASGYGLCRNIAALLTDVYRELGIDADNIGVKISRLLDNYHACVIVSSKEGSFIIDPTWQSVLTLDKEKKQGINNTKFYGYKYKNNYSLLEYEDENYYHELITQEYLNSKEKTRNITPEELRKKYIKMKELILKSKIYDNTDPEEMYEKALNNLEEFVKKERSYSELSELEQELTLVKKR